MAYAERFAGEVQGEIRFVARLEMDPGRQDLLDQVDEDMKTNENKPTYEEMMKKYEEMPSCSDGGKAYLWLRLSTGLAKSLPWELQRMRPPLARHLLGLSAAEPLQVAQCHLLLRHALGNTDQAPRRGAGRHPPQRLPIQVAPGDPTSTYDTNMACNEFH